MNKLELELITKVNQCQFISNQINTFENDIDNIPVIQAVKCLITERNHILESIAILKLQLKDGLK